MIHRAARLAPSPRPCHGGRRRDEALPRDPEPIGGARRRARAWAPLRRRRAARARARPRWTGSSAACSREVLDEPRSSRARPGRSPTSTPTAALPAARVLVVGLGPQRARAATPSRCVAPPPPRVRRARDLGAPTSPSRCSPPTGCPRAPARPGDRGRRDARHLSLRQVPQGEERQGRRRAAPWSSPTRRSAAAARARACARGEICGRGHLSRARPGQRAGQRGARPPTWPSARPEIAEAGGLTLQVLDRADCAKLGMGAYLGVAQGSEEPPKFIHLTYTPKRPARRKRVAVIGKGITFDSGGLDLKTADGMLRMKDDMSGAAAVLGIFQALPALKPPVEVHGLIAATENMPSGTAPAPGRHRARHERAHHRDRQHRRRGPAHAGRRALLRGQGDQARRDDRHGDAHRRRA